MFRRLFLTYLLLVVAAAGLAAGAVVRRVDVAAAAAAAAALASAPAYFLAQRLARPLDELTEGARRLAEGDLGHTVHTTGGREFAALARAFNAMSERLAASFAQVEHDRERLLAILSGMVEGVIAFDTEQRVLFANDRAAALLGFPAEQAVGRKLWEVSRHRALGEMVGRAFSGPGPQRQELDWGGPVVKSLAVYVSRLPGADSPGAVMVLHDTTDLRRLERLRQDFVANVSHELKTPLANIKSSVEVLLDGAADDPNLRVNFLSEIDQQADRLHALILDLLVLARVESGEAGLELGCVPLEDAVHACLDRHRTRAEAKGLTLGGVALGASPPDLAIWADEEALAQILDNLVDNAIKYTPRDGRVTVRYALAPESEVTIEVEDTGVGIPLRDQPRVFERFYRVDKARSREVGGTGLGLAIVKHLVQAMNGTVAVTSKIGSGSTFRVTLPRAGGS